MATFLLYFSQDGVPATGLYPFWNALYRADGQSVMAFAPAVSEIGGGWYRFELAKGIAPWDSGQLVGVIDGGAQLGGAERYLPVIISEQTLERQADLTLGEAVADHKAAAGSLAADVNLIRQTLAGKRSQEVATGVIRIYDEDNATVLRSLRPGEEDGVLSINQD